MRSSERREYRIRVALYLTILAIAALYIGQGPILHLRLHLLGAQEPALSHISEQCIDKDCTSEWSLVPAQQFLLLGHIMRTHSLIEGGSGEQVFPVSRVRGVSADSWNSLRVYSVTPGKTYRLVATKPAAVKMGYFVGVLPRTSDHEGMLSIPDVSPTVSVLTSLIGFGALGVLIFAAFLAPTSGVGARSRRDALWSVTVSSFAALIFTAISAGIVDSLLPDGEFRSRVLRTALIVSIVLVPLKRFLEKFALSSRVAITAAIVLVCFAVNLNWQYLRAGTPWIVTYGLVVSSLAVYLLITRQIFAACITVLAIFDPLKMANVISVPDVPPVYLLQVMLVAAFSVVVADLGAVSVIALAAKAYQRFTRDISLSKISDVFSRGEDSSQISESIRLTLPHIAQMTGAKRVSILMNLPFGRPITHGYNLDDQKFVTYDDGRIPGAVTVRAFVYGDEAWYERYSDFASRLGIASSTQISAEYICIAPIRVNQTNMGVLMLTCFDDKHIDRAIANGDIESERESAKLVVDTIAGKFSDVVIDSLKFSSSQSADLLAKVRELIPSSGSVQDFLEQFCSAIFSVTQTRTMIHQWIGDQGVAMAQAGFEDDHWKFFVDSPFNLKPTAVKAYGSTVVAFKEQKASYLKDWNEIRDKLHPKTVHILDAICGCSFLAVPLRCADQRFVVTMISHRSQTAKEPGLMRIVESTEAIFDAAVTVLNQRTSVLALGKLANRLIGDDDVRSKIVEAAKEEHLRTTIGTPRTSFLLLFDLAGSSRLPSDTEDKARSYGVFYDEVNKISQAVLGGKVRKTIGDAVIVTWDGTNSALEDKSGLFESLKAVVGRANAVAKEVGCNGVRAVLHHGDYFFGLVGTSSFGQIDVIGRGIDEVCKLEGAMKGLLVGGSPIKVGISVSASIRLPLLTADSGSGYSRVDIDAPAGRMGLAWVCTDLSEDEGGVRSPLRAS